MDIILFGDQTVDFRSFLNKVLLRQNSPLLSQFLQRTHDMLRDEVSQLSKEHRKIIPSFSTVHELVERYFTTGKSNAAIESSLVCVAQLSHFIGFYEDNPWSYLKSDKTEIIGVCTGLIAASAVASCDSLAALVPLASEAVRVAFRLGSRVSSNAECLEQAPLAQKCWSKIVTGADAGTVEAAVNSFNKSQILSSNKVYISSSATAATTISGPPSMLQRLFENSPSLNSASQRDLPIYGPYHAPHLYSNTADIIPGDTAAIMDLYSPVYKVSGLKVPKPAKVVDLFESAVMQILAEPICWQEAIERCSAEVKKFSSSTYRILAMGPTTLGNSLASSLRILGKGLTLTLEDHVSWISKNQIPTGIRNNLPGCNIAIIGMSGRFPDAANLDAFWKLLESGLDVHREVPPDRFDAKAHTDASGKGKNKSHTPYGCFIEQPGLFDPRFFNMSPREAAQTDPMQRLAITTAYEAMESSGFVVNRTATTMAHRVGTFFGQTSDDWREINAAQDIDTYFITGGVRAFGPGRINYHFGFSGPSFSVDTACSSSFAAIQLACTSLRANDCDTAFAGGMNVLTNPDIFSGLSKGQFLSKTGGCKTYDNDADGYCRGDGVATLILKRLEDAISDKDPILGVIRGTATNHSAEAVSITHPHVGAQQFLFQKIMDDVGVDVRDVKYVEFHGTGTQAGDSVEMESVTSIFAPRERRRRRPDQPLFVGSVKANIAHGEAVSGACALIKVMMMLQKSMIPPHCGIKGRINQTFAPDLKVRGVNIAFKPTEFPRPAGGSRFVFINNFSAAGGNTAMLIEDAPIRSIVGVDPRSTHVVIVSAKSLASFRKNIAQLLSYTSKNPDLDIASLAYTTTARRYHYNYRMAFVASDVEHLRSSLAKLTEVQQAPIPSAEPRTGFVFTGQGSQYSGMAKALYEDSKSFSHEVKSLCDLAGSQGFDSRSILGLVTGSDDIKTSSPVSVQLSITIIQIALARYWISLGVQPSVVIGHSLGEYAGLHIASVISASDAISLVGKRAQLLVSRCTSNTHCMLAVKCNLSRIEALVDKLSVEVACINGPEETVLSGLSDVISAVEKNLTNKGFKCTKLNTPFAFHSSQVEPILESFREAAKSTVFHAPRIPVISPLLAQVIRAGCIIGPEYLASHCRDAVDFAGGLKAALDDNTINENFLWIECGPHPICSNMIKATIDPKVITTASLIRNENSWKTVSSSIALLYNAGVKIDWQEFFKGFENAVEVLPIPTYSFDEKIYWLEYKNNWTLTKGEIAAAPAPVIAAKPAFSTTSIQKIIQEDVKGNSAFIVAQSNLCEPLLAATISGHLVNGQPLCPSSLFADMALTLCEYAYSLLRPGADGSEIGYNVCQMEAHKSLVLDLKATSQIFQISINFNLDQKTANVEYKTVASDGKASENARCLVKLEDSKQWLLEYQRRAHLVTGRIESLQTGRNVHTIYRGMAYKLFAALVNYDHKYRGMEEVKLDSKNLEATARVIFQTTPKDGNFVMSPYFIDSVCHISGFIINATDAVDSSTQVYISHGWESLRFARKLEADKTYQSYVKMIPVENAGKMVAGDVYIFDGEELIGMVGALKFQCIPRRLMDTLLGTKTSSAPRASIAKTAVIAPKEKVQKLELVQFDSDSGSESEAISSTPGIKTPGSTISSTYDGADVDNGDQIITTIRTTIANEMGVDIEEISDTADLSNMGMDSLMSLSILGILREETGMDFSSDFLLENPSMADIKKTLGLDGSKSPKISSSAPSNPAVTELKKPEMGPLASYPQAQCILLQGNPKTAKRTLFFLPDGSGAAAAYAAIPELGSDVAAFGLNCPFMKTPELFTIGIKNITKIYMAAIKKRQPMGPYILGGWSAGGVLAYEMTRQLVAQGETVSKLILLDSPNPVGLEALPPVFHAFCNRIGLLGDGETKSPSWLLPHFAATVRELTAYSEELKVLGEIDTRGFPQTTTIWVRDGIIPKDSEERPEWDESIPMPNSMYWLCHDRTDMGDNGWERLVGKGKVRCVNMEGNHFTMMRQPLIKEVGRLVKEALNA